MRPVPHGHEGAAEILLRTDRGMLFEYQHRAHRNFWMKNCRIPIDLAYIREGKIEQIHTMEAQFGAAHQHLRWYPSQAAIKFALEMPAGWFERAGVRVGDGVSIQ